MGNLTLAPSSRDMWRGWLGFFKRDSLNSFHINHCVVDCCCYMVLVVYNYKKNVMYNLYDWACAIWLFLAEFYANLQDQFGNSDKIWGKIEKVFFWWFRFAFISFKQYDIVLVPGYRYGTVLCLIQCCVWYNQFNRLHWMKLCMKHNIVPYWHASIKRI